MYNNPRFNGNQIFKQFKRDNDEFSDFKRPFNHFGHPRLPYRHHLKPTSMLSETLLLPSAMQPPPMFGPRGATLPPRNPNPYNARNEQFQSETSEYWCETCDRNFKSSAQLESHKSEHQQCKIDGCKFVAHPKVITKHIQMQHSNGLFQKIAKLSNPEEVQKWIEERKKRYPTQLNIEKKNLQKEERKKRGEKMGMTKHTFNPKHSSKPYERREIQETKRNRRPNKNKKQASQVVETKTISKDIELVNKNIKAFRGIHEIVMRDIQEEIQPITLDQNQIDDDESEVTPHTPSEESSLTTSTGVQNVCGALVNLMASYASDDEEPMETIITKSIEKQNSKEKNINEDGRTAADEGSDNETPCEITNESAKQNISEDCPPSPPKRKRIRKNDLPKDSNSLNLNNRFKMQRNSRLKRFSRTPSTLLEKLLAKEIKHERNVVLQCIRYIVKNQYFDGKSTSQSEG